MKFKHILIVVLILTIAASTGSFAEIQEIQEVQEGSITIIFDEPLQDSGEVYQLILEEDIVNYTVTEADRVDKDKLMATLVNHRAGTSKEFFYGMSEDEVNKLMNERDEDIIVVLTLGQNASTETKKERAITSLNFKYDDDKLYEIIVSGDASFKAGNFAGLSEDDVRSSFGDALHMDVHNPLYSKGLFEYQWQSGYIFFYTRNGIVEKWGFSNRTKRFEKNWPAEMNVVYETANIGNSSGNLLNEGLVASDDEYIYYAQPLGEAVATEALYRMQQNGIGKNPLTTDTPRYINVYGDWVYYCNQEDSNDVGQGRIYRVKTDGSAREQLTTIGATNLVMDKEHLYFISDGDGVGDPPGLYKVSLEGNDLQQLAEGKISSLVVQGDELFYIIETTLGKTNEVVDVVQRIDNEGASKRDIITGDFRQILVDGYCLYFIDEARGLKVYEVYFDDVMGGDAQLSTVGVVGMNMSAEHLHFQTIFNEYIMADKIGIGTAYKDNSNQYNTINLVDDKLYFKQDIEGRGPLYETVIGQFSHYPVATEVAPVAFIRNQVENNDGRVAATKEWIYYSNSVDYDRLYRINKGSGAIERLTHDSALHLFVFNNQVGFVSERLQNLVGTSDYTFSIFDETTELIQLVSGYDNFSINACVTGGEQMIIGASNDLSKDGFVPSVMLTSNEDLAMIEESDLIAHTGKYFSNKWIYLRESDYNIGQQLYWSPDATHILEDIFIKGAWNDALYYTSGVYGEHGLYRMNSVTKVTEQVNELPIFEAVLYGNKLIYTEKDGRALCLSDVDGSNRIELVAEDAFAISVVDGWIFFHDYEYQKRVRVDGTGLEVLKTQIEENK